MKTLLSAMLVLVVSAFVHYYIHADNRRQVDATRIAVLEETLRMHDAIYDDQVRELANNLQTALAEKNFAKTEGFVSGVADAQQRPDHYSQIWHNGYDRGTSVQQDLMKVQEASKK